MPRGQRKPLDEKIQAKQELIIALQKRIDSETKELEELLQQKKYKELQIVSDMMENANLTSEEVTEVFPRLSLPFPLPAFAHVPLLQLFLLLSLPVSFPLALESYRLIYVRDLLVSLLPLRLQYVLPPLLPRLLFLPFLPVLSHVVLSKF